MENDKAINCLMELLKGENFMSADYTNIALQKSLLSWERGLKYGIKAVTKSVGNGRSSRGNVD